MKIGILGFSLLIHSFFDPSNSFIINPSQTFNKKTLTTQSPQTKYPPLSPIIKKYNNELYESRIGIIDTGVDTSHYKLGDQVIKYPIMSEFHKIACPIIAAPVGVNLVDNKNYFFNPEIAKLYKPDYLKFSELHKKITSFRPVDWPEAKWYLSKIYDRKFMTKLYEFKLASHGTHVTGITLKDNPNAKFMSIRFLSDDPPPSHIKKRINNGNHLLLPSVVENQMFKIIQNFLNEKKTTYSQMAQMANKFKIDVINLSIGFISGDKIINNILGQNGFKLNPEFQKKLAAMYDQGQAYHFKTLIDLCPDTLFVMAAGNEHENMDSTPYLQMLSHHPRGVVVAALDDKNRLAPFSNFGLHSVNIAAQGVDIFSSVPGDGMINMSGTSQATPQVTRAASILKDEMPELTPENIKKILVLTSINLPEVSNKIMAGILDEYGALEYIKDLKKGYNTLEKLDSIPL